MNKVNKMNETKDVKDVNEIHAVRALWIKREPCKTRIKFARKLRALALEKRTAKKLAEDLKRAHTAKLQEIRLEKVAVADKAHAEKVLARAQLDALNGMKACSLE
jgi:hypothetical protein